MSQSTQSNYSIYISHKTNWKQSPHPIFPQGSHMSQLLLTITSSDLTLLLKKQKAKISTARTPRPILHIVKQKTLYSIDYVNNCNTYWFQEAMLF